jgi:hypothetical protein
LSWGFGLVMVRFMELGIGDLGLGIWGLFHMTVWMVPGWVCYRFLYRSLAKLGSTLLVDELKTR